MQGCVYEMSRDAYEALWRSEGGAMKKTPYQEVVVSVRDASGRDVDAITCQVCARRGRRCLRRVAAMACWWGDVAAMACWWGSRGDGVLVG